jgi:hypothetical protein
LLGKRAGVLTDVNAHKSAINTFYTKYSKLPGDFHLASRAFPNCNASNTGDEPCNGNQDGIIGESESLSGDSITGEQLRAWQHLLEARVIEGSYSGVLSGTDAQEINVNVPQSPIEAGAFWLRGGIAAYSGEYRPNSLVLGGFGDKKAFTGGVMDASLALAIDIAGDDGMPNTGSIRASKGLDAAGAEIAGCTTGTGASAEYNPQSAAISCVMEFHLD